jgi:hypothetical protein
MEPVRAEREGRSGRAEAGAAALGAEKGRGRRTARGGARRAAAGRERGAAAGAPPSCAEGNGLAGGGRRQKMMTGGTRAPVTGERSCFKVYVFAYACSWAQDVSIRLLWHFCGKQKIAVVYFKIGEL